MWCPAGWSCCGKSESVQRGGGGGASFSAFFFDFCFLPSPLPTNRCGVPTELSFLPFLSLRIFLFCDSVINNRTSIVTLTARPLGDTSGSIPPVVPRSIRFLLQSSSTGPYVVDIVEEFQQAVDRSTLHGEKNTNVAKNKIEDHSSSPSGHVLFTILGRRRSKQLVHDRLLGRHRNGPKRRNA